jgi:ketoreductase
VKLSGKVALVTGGGTGIGKAISKALAGEGARVAIASRNPNHLQSAQEDLRRSGIEVSAIQVDVRKKREVENAVAGVARPLGIIHILINNAGVSGMNRMENPDDSRWYDIIETNLSGTYLTTKEALKYMKDPAGGRIINVSSVLGRFGVPGYTAYCSSKHGILGFTKALALEVVNRGITVNAICPGWVDTEMARQGIAETAAHQGITAAAFQAQAIEAMPIKRFLDPDEIAALVVYLCSAEAGGITGQAFNICGGQTMN